MDRVLHEHRKRTSTPNIIRRNRLAALARRDDHRAEPLAHVPQARRQRADGPDIKWAATGESGIDASRRARVNRWRRDMGPWRLGSARAGVNILRVSALSRCGLLS